MLVAIIVHLLLLTVDLSYVEVVPRNKYFPSFAILNYFNIDTLVDRLKSAPIHLK